MDSSIKNLPNHENSLGQHAVGKETAEASAMSCEHNSPRRNVFKVGKMDIDALFEQVPFWRPLQANELCTEKKQLHMQVRKHGPANTNFKKIKYRMEHNRAHLSTLFLRLFFRLVISVLPKRRSYISRRYRGKFIVFAIKFYFSLWLLNFQRATESLLRPGVWGLADGRPSETFRSLKKFGPGMPLLWVSVLCRETTEEYPPNSPNASREQSF